MNKLRRIAENCAELRQACARRTVAVEHLADLPCDQRLAGAGRAVEQHPLHVLHAELLHHARREDPARERAAEDRRKLGVEPADAHLLKVPILAEDRVRLLLGQAGEGERRARRLPRQQLRLRAQQPAHRRAAAAALDELEVGDGELVVLAVELEGDELAGGEVLVGELVEQVRHERRAVERLDAALRHRADVVDVERHRRERRRRALVKLGDGDRVVERDLEEAPLHRVEPDAARLDLRGR